MYVCVYVCVYAGLAISRFDQFALIGYCAQGGPADMLKCSMLLISQWCK